jgi:hypothetical protein
VRLRFSDDTVLEDWVDGEELVLFLSTSPVALAAKVEILDGHGHLLARHPSGLGEAGPDVTRLACAVAQDGAELLVGVGEVRWKSAGWFLLNRPALHRWR